MIYCYYYYYYYYYYYHYYYYYYYYCYYYFTQAACKEGLKASDPSQRVEAEAWSACLRALCAELGAEAFKRAARQATSI